MMLKATQAHPVVHATPSHNPAEGEQREVAERRWRTETFHKHMWEAQTPPSVTAQRSKA